MIFRPKPILITGSHRSGSTWVGKTLSEADGVNYIHEPFNIDLKHRKSPLRHWFEYIQVSSPQDRQNQLENFIKQFYLPEISFHSLNSGYRLKKSLKDWVCYFNNRQLIKDPIALFSAPWFYRQFNCSVVVCIRHPAAFVASLKIKGWTFDFNNFLDQPNLMKDYLFPFRKEIEEYAKNPPSIIFQGILLWNCIYHCVSIFEENYKNEWLFVKHEDLSRKPIEGFGEIYASLNLNFSKIIKASIISTTNAQKPGELKRNAIENLNSWKKRLTLEEIAEIKIRTKTIWTQYYNESDW